MNKDDKKLSAATTRRLPLYYRCLADLSRKGEDKVSSTILADLLKIDAATIRRDFSHFGQMGRRGYGYDIEILLALFNEALQQSTTVHVALVGVGNLGHALLNFNFRQIGNARISAAFDINQEIVGTVQSKVPVYDILDLREQIKDQEIQVAIMTVPTEHAQEVANLLVDAGIKGIMNFTTAVLNVPESVAVQNIDLSLELQSLIYAVNKVDLTELNEI